MRTGSLLITGLLFLLCACETKTKTVDSCGDGFLDPGEECDGSSLPVLTCSELGYYEQAGSLSCKRDCTIDLSVCSLRCGDGIISTTHEEKCEGENLNGETCLSIGLGGGTLSCNEFCRFNITACESQAVCGDGVVTSPFEHCDGALLNDQTCETQGYYGGSISCNTECHFDLSGCAAYGRCGDGEIQDMYGELCDGSRLDGQTCVSLGYYGGTLTCGSDCRFQTGNCEAAGWCGDEILQGDHGEICDGARLNGQTCISRGFHGGTLGCAGDCGSYDESDCEAVGRCGDGLLQESFEACDGLLLGGMDCIALGFHGGALACLPDCSTLDESDCEAVGRCGDGIVQGDHGEECDGTNLDGLTCLDFGFYQGILTCDSQCRFIITGCQLECGDTLIQTTYGEVCDGTDLDSQTCLSRGYYGGTLACSGDCRTFDESACATVGRCGDSLIQTAFSEACDGANLNTQTCVLRGFYGGNLACASDCRTFDESACATVGRCGDSLIQTTFSEVCDGANLNSETCVSRGYYGGNLACAGDCRTFDESVCATFGRCGDALIQTAQSEICDGANLNSETCVSRGYYGGNLACATSCQAFDETACIAAGRCGDGTVQTAYGEECDGGNLNAQTCLTLEFDGGVLSCGSGCRFVTSACITYCNDGVIQSSYGEVCDGLNLDGETCISQGYHGGVLTCGATCKSFDETDCASFGWCGDHVFQPAYESCEDLELDGESCRSLGWFTGTLACSGTCLFDESGCADAVEISTGANHTCARLDDGRIRCWGYNINGQIGNGTTTVQRLPVYVNTINTATGIDAGELHTCAVLADGTARCWGNNGSGRLGNGTTTNASSPVTVAGLSTVADIAAGATFSCAVLTAGTGRCWGNNDSGQLGDGTTTTRFTAVAVSGLITAEEITAGKSHACARLADGSVSCWGLNTDGQLGNGTFTSSAVPVPVSGLTDAVALSAGEEFTCALRGTGAVVCWGANSYNQLGNGTSTRSNVPVSVSGVSGAVSVGAGYDHACAVMDSGMGKCWGFNGNAQIGDGSTTSHAFPEYVSGLTSGAAIDGGLGHSCALLTDGQVSCWGENSQGQTGFGYTFEEPEPSEVVNLTGALSVAAGENFSCALLSDQTIRCWGWGMAGQLGVPATYTYDPVTPAVAGATGLALGTGHTCARLSDGTIACWGANGLGQLGNGTTTSSHNPVFVTGINSAVRVTAGTYHTCAVLSDSTARCWGGNGQGRLGDGTTTNSSTPVTVSGLSGVAGLFAGESHTCALRSDGTARCWGSNDYGELGNGTTTGSLTPVTVSGLTSAAGLFAGVDYSCAWRTDGTVQCWGANTSGQLGDGTYSTRTSPVTVPGLSNVTSLAGRNLHTCAGLSDGSARCWGQNTYYKLGDGTKMIRTSPVTVTGLTGTTGVATGLEHSCARLSNGTVRCWGYNIYGQVGVDFYTKVLTPVRVVP